MGTAPKGHDSGAGTLAWKTGPHFLTVPVIPWKSCFASLGLSFSMCQAGSKGGIDPEGFQELSFLPLELEGEKTSTEGRLCFSLASSSPALWKEQTSSLRLTCCRFIRREDWWQRASPQHLSGPVPACPPDCPSKLVSSARDHVRLHRVFSISLGISQVAPPGMWGWGSPKVEPRGLEHGFVRQTWLYCPAVLLPISKSLGEVLQV